MLKRGVIQEHAALLAFLMRVLDLTALLLAFFAAYWLYFSTFELQPIYFYPLVLGAGLALLLFPLFSVYGSLRGAPFWLELRNLSFALLALFVLLAVVGVLSKSNPLYSRIWFGSWFLLSWAFFLLYRGALRLLLGWMRRQGYNQRCLIVLGCGPGAEEVVQRINKTPWSGFQVVAAFGDLEQGELNGVPIAGGYEDVARYLSSNHVDQVWIALPLSEAAELKRVLHLLRHSTVDIRYVPDLFGFKLLNQSISEVAGMPVLDLSKSPMSGMNQFVKAVEDRLLGLLIFVLIMPFLLLIALGVKLTSPGPVLFKQKRHGWDGREIRVYKFRSMVVHQEGAGVVTQAKKGDARITPFGAFLRRTSLDELPQFFNVLQGRMSIVGPRPHALAHNEAFKDKIEQYMLRHKVKPGITGWAQVNGYRGETDTLYKMQKRVEYDLNYIENWSLWLDLKIIFLTIFKGFLNKNAY
ncbi:MAG: undecaprenyl-phosphate glucose phosphotransferase [Gammaproteobacteria bacterium]|nr:undecaprenyl-phosphate glucose phosphotransferase [Gammaproteobacteria bacterium]